MRSSIFKIAIALVFSLLFGSPVFCASGGAPAHGDLPDEVSIKEDRQSLDDFRKDIPEERKRENDELAALLKLMPQTDDTEPSEFRSRFSTMVSRRRDSMDKILREKRETFSNEERKNRETALKALAAERATYLKDKHSSDERNEFFGKQDDQRRSYFAKQEEKRKDFESGLQDERKHFEDYIRETTNRFNDLYRDYLSRYYERKKNEDLKRRMEEKAKDKARVSEAARGESGYQSVDGGDHGERDDHHSGEANAVPRGKTSDEDAMLREFRNIPKTPAVPLGAGDSK